MITPGLSSHAWLATVATSRVGHVKLRTPIVLEVLLPLRGGARVSAPPAWAWKPFGAALSVIEGSIWRLLAAPNVLPGSRFCKPPPMSLWIEFAMSALLLRAAELAARVTRVGLLRTASSTTTTRLLLRLAVSCASTSLSIPSSSTSAVGSHSCVIAEACAAVSAKAPATVRRR